MVLWSAAGDYVFGASGAPGEAGVSVDAYSIRFGDQNVRKSWRLMWLAAFIVPVLAQPVSAGSWNKSPLGHAEFGKLWIGKPFETADLAGKVVLVVWWTDTHGNSAQALSDVVSLEKELVGSGVVMVCVALQSEKDKSVRMAKRAKVGFPIVSGVRLSEPKKPKFAPSFTVFDRDGQVVYHTTQQAEQSILDAVKIRTTIIEATGREPLTLMIDPREYHEKNVVRLAKRATKGTGLGRLLDKIEQNLADGTKAQKAEAARLRQELTDYSERMNDEAAKTKSDRPHRHFDIHEELAKSFRGHKIGERHQALIQTIENDPRQVDEIAASRLVEKLKTATEKGKKSIYRKIKRKYANTEIGRKALADENAG